MEVGGETKFCCADGPEFDGHKVNFDLLMSRQKMYLDQEELAMEVFEKSQKSKVKSQKDKNGELKAGGANV